MIKDTKPYILPPAMLGILGGGQLGSMFTQAAKTMGYHVTVLDPDPNAPAARFADTHLCVPFNDVAGLEQLATCAAVTTEFENVSAQAMLDLAKLTRISPSGHSVAIAQNRVFEKEWILKAGLETAPYQVLSSIEDIDETMLAYLPGILKTATMGYDGKGQTRVSTLTELKNDFLQDDNRVYVLEKMLDLRAEISVIVARLDNEHIETFPVAENEHENGILSFSTVPASLPDDILCQAQAMAKQLAHQLDYVGVLTVELFVVGDDQHLIVNEIAPRPHNSGHYTLDACVSDQFQQQVRLMCGLPPLKTDLLTPVCMANILGDLWGEHQESPYWARVLKDTGTHLHLYGKKEARKGRKMGHFTVLSDDAVEARKNAENMHQELKYEG